MQPRNDGMAERLTTGEDPGNRQAGSQARRRTVKPGRAGPCSRALTALEYRSAPDEETEYTSRHSLETQERERATVKDDVASVAPEILLDAGFH